MSTRHNAHISPISPLSPQQAPAVGSADRPQGLPINQRVCRSITGSADRPEGLPMTRGSADRPEGLPIDQRVCRSTRGSADRPQGLPMTRTSPHSTLGGLYNYLHTTNLQSPRGPSVHPATPVRRPPETRRRRRSTLQ